MITCTSLSSLLTGTRLALKTSNDSGFWAHRPHPTPASFETIHSSSFYLTTKSHRAHPFVRQSLSHLSICVRNTCLILFHVT